MEQCEEWVTIGRAARAVGRSERTIERWIAAGRLPVYRDARGFRVFRSADLDPLRPTRIEPAPALPAGDPPNGTCERCGAPRTSYRARWCDACEASADRERRP